MVRADGRACKMIRRPYMAFGTLTGTDSPVRNATCHLFAQPFFQGLVPVVNRGRRSRREEASGLKEPLGKSNVDPRDDRTPALNVSYLVEAPSSEVPCNALQMPPEVS